MKNLKLVSVPLALPDVLSSLSTGIIDAAYAPPLGILALQWQTKVKYLLNFPVAYSIGALLISNKAWDKISPEHQKIVKDIATKYQKQVADKTVKETQEGLEAIKSAGVKFISFPDKDIQQGKKIRNDVIKALQGKMISAEGVKLINQKIK